MFIANIEIEQLQFFQQFGDCFRTILMNVHSYRKGLKYGFTEICFDQYGWLKRASFLDQEEFVFGKRLNSENKVEIGRGQNQRWIYGTAGSICGLSVCQSTFFTSSCH